MILPVQILKYKTKEKWGARGVMVIVAGIGHGEFKSWTDCISHSINTLGKGMNPIIIPPTMGK